MKRKHIFNKTRRVKDRNVADLISAQTMQWSSALSVNLWSKFTKIATPPVFWTINIQLTDRNHWLMCRGCDQSNSYSISHVFGSLIFVLALFVSGNAIGYYLLTSAVVSCNVSKTDENMCIRSACTSQIKLQNIAIALFPRQNVGLNEGLYVRAWSSMCNYGTIKAKEHPHVQQKQIIFNKWYNMHVHFSQVAKHDNRAAR